MTYTKHEILAFQMLGVVNLIPNFFTTFCDVTPHDAGNKIIALAEQIKAERAVSAMEVKG